MATLEALGKYEIKGSLGRGAMGIVYEGWDPIIARRVAIKTVRLPDHADPETEEALARFRREAQAAGRLIHPNIVGVFDYGETTELAYIVMEYVDGPPLKSLLDKQERFELAATARIMEDLLTGLQYSHERGVVHRDIKPANVMLTSAGQAKIADFGIARIESSSMTQAGTVLGTPAYMSPEQFMGQVVDARTDIYSSGVLLYQLLTGERPFEGSMSAIMHKALNTEPPMPSQLSVTSPQAFDAVVRRAMSKRPEERYPSATAFAEAIRDAAAGRSEPVSEAEATTIVAPRAAAAPVTAARGAVATPRVTPAAPPARRSPLPMIAAGVVGLAVVLGGGAWWFLRGPPGQPLQDAATSHAPVIGANAPQPPIATPEAPPQVAAADTPPPASPAVQVPNPVQAQAPPLAPPSASPVPDVTKPPPAPTAQTSTTQALTTQAATNPPPTIPPVTPPTPPAPQPATTPPTPTAPSQVVEQQQASLVDPTPKPAQPVANTQVALAGVQPQALRRQIADWLAVRNCTLIEGDARDGGSVLLSGLAGNSVVGEIQQGIAAISPAAQIDWRVNGVDPVFCPVLTALHPIVPGAGGRLGLNMADGKTRLHDGELVRVRLVMPDFPSRLRVDYVSHDGSVQHLYPQLADAAAGITADVPRTFAPREVVDLRNPAWTIGEPYGTDIVIAIASSEPLLTHPRPSNAETIDGYIKELQANIDAANRRGVSLSAAAVTLDALPK